MKKSLLKHGPGYKVRFRSKHYASGTGPTGTILKIGIDLVQVKWDNGSPPSWVSYKQLDWLG